MGMYDDVRFHFRMPDGYERGHYQSKDFDCLLDVYEVDAAGRLVRTSVGGITDEDRTRPEGDMEFNGMLNVYASDVITRKWHEYDLEFVDGTLKAIHCHQTESQMLFEPPEMAQRNLPG